MLKVYILIVVLGLVGGVVYGGYYYYKDTQARIATLTENSAKLEVAAQTQKQTIDTLVADAKKYEKLNSELHTSLGKANDYKNRRDIKTQAYNQSDGERERLMSSLRGSGRLEITKEGKDSCRLPSPLGHQ